MARWTGNGLADGTAISSNGVANTAGNGDTVARAGSGATTFATGGDGFDVVGGTAAIARIDATLTATRGIVGQVWVTPGTLLSANEALVVARTSANNVGQVLAGQASGTITLTNAAGTVLSAANSPARVAGHLYRIDVIFQQNSGTRTTSNGRIVLKITDMSDNTWATGGVWYYDTGHTVDVQTADMTVIRFGKHGVGNFSTTWRFEELGWDPVTLPSGTTGQSNVEPYFMPSPYVSAAAALAGVGGLTAPGVVGKAAGGVLSGTGSLSGVGTVGQVGTAALTGTGALSAAGVVGVMGSATLAGTGALTADGDVEAPVSGDLDGDATLTGTGALAATGVLGESGSAALSGVGALTAASVIGRGAGAALTGTGTLTAAGVVGVTGAAVLTGTGTLTATAGSNLEAAAALTGVGTLTAAGVVGVVATASLNGTAALSATGTRGLVSDATLEGIGALTAAQVRALYATAELAGIGSVLADSTLGLSGIAELNGVGVLTARGKVPYDGPPGVLTVTAITRNGFTVHAAHLVPHTVSAARQADFNVDRIE